MESINFKINLTPSSSVSVINFEQVNAGWVYQFWPQITGNRKLSKTCELSNKSRRLPRLLMQSQVHISIFVCNFVKAFSIKLLEFHCAPLLKS